ncbi:MAG: hypothetical protein WEE67_04240 [Chloroflexota bacterium]
MIVRPPFSGRPECSRPLGDLEYKVERVLMAARALAMAEASLGQSLPLAE